ncbi:uncharacterized protein LOC117642389 [Thrips palmi]|uniref:Uncharacterized protein LOC117642389 n=1 Tax=Thrips palmi TaxID=161013 RepID=A0A6P8ZK29_THRPL|nr:uncharacterized protein LOC117642389 [Thrips palmi]
MTHISFSEIIRQERSRNANRQIRSRLTYRGLRSSMQRSRNGVFPRIPSNLRELTAIHQNPAWAHLTRTTDLQDFIYSGSVDSLDGSHSVIYCSERNLQHLREVPVMFADGTFYISPSIDNCYQVFTIVCVYGHTVIPLLWCLMERKTEAAYVSVLVHLRIRLGHWNFTQVICDFEDAIMNAFRRVFDVVVQGCFFHYVSVDVFVEIEDATVDDLNSLNQGLIPNRHRSCSSISNDENIIALTNQLLQYPLPSDEQIMTFLHSASFSVDSVIQEALDLEYDEVNIRPKMCCQVPNLAESPKIILSAFFFKRYRIKTCLTIEKAETTYWLYDDSTSQMFIPLD